jgi:hypothetical protein
MSTENRLAAAAINTLHSARGLPSKEAAGVLKDFLNLISSVRPDGSEAAASDALKHLVHKLEVEGSASDDDWQSAIETMVSVANETS